MPSAYDRRFGRSAFPRHESYFGEPITYFLRDGGQRSFNAIINRDPPAFYDSVGNVVLPEFTIEFSRDCKDGILASEVDTGGDEVELLAEVDATIPVRKTVLKIISQDSSVLVLALK